MEAARAAAARAGAELAAVNQYLRTAGSAAGAAPLSESLDVEPGYELALAAALGPRLGAGLVDSVGAGENRRSTPPGDDGGLVIVAGERSAEAGGGRPAGARAPSGCSTA